MTSDSSAGGPGRDTLETRRPTTIRNGWGALRIDVRCMSRIGDASTTQVAICIRHFEPLELGVMRSLRRLELTPTQITLCVHFVRGRSTQAQLAAMLGVSATTIHHHLRKVYDRLGVHSREELVATLKAC
jgi:DNA-binding CsgD family transcriptional regulator